MSVSKPVLLFIMTLVILSPLKAQDKVEQKLDTVLSNQKVIISKQDKIYEEVRYDDPLANKIVGLELNPARLLFVSSDKRLSLSGGISLLKIDRRAEIAFPFLYESRREDNPRYFSIDGQYRRFIGKHQNGFFLSAGVRYLNIKGESGGEFDDIFGNPTREIATANKFGAMFGVGYRFFTKSGFYWGTSLTVGRYFHDTDKRFVNVWLDDDKFLVDFEILKFGITL